MKDLSIARTRTQEPWMRTLKVGDTLVSFKGRHRVVQELRRYHNGDLHGVALATDRRLGRAVTWIKSSSLIHQGYTPL